MPKRLTTDVFIERSQKIHGNKYDYSKSVYRNVRSKILVICPIHGEFEQKAELHLVGYGCPDCGGTKKLTLDELIERSRKVHGHKYDYSQSIFANVDSKIDIRCTEHGLFSQRAMDHMKGRGCPKCGGTAKKTTQEFIKKAKKVHGVKYNYSDSEYVNDATPISIKCKVHGKFKQTPNDHLKGHGCWKCTSTAPLSTDIFIERATDVHRDKFDYSQVEYTTSHKKVEIICPDHGIFEQRAYSHLQGIGCPKCSESKGERKIRR